MLQQYRHDLQMGLKTEEDLCQWTCDYQIRAFSYGKLSPAEEDEDDCMCPPLPIYLMRICRQVYEDVSNLIYSENKFKLVLDTPVRLTHRVLAKMISLNVRLTRRYCTSEELLCVYPNMQVTSLLGSGSLDTHEAVTRWKSFCKEYGGLLSPRMRFTLIANCADETTGSEIVEATDSFPQIDHCTIRLSDTVDPDLRELAESTVFKVTHRAGSKQSPFRLLDLPVELQREILLLTDLVCPSYITVRWDPARSTLFQPFMPTSDDQARLTACCTGCSDSLDRCCCVTRYSNASSQQCKCWRLPFALFRTCKKLHELATEVFYSVNKFILRCDLLPDSWGPGSPENFRPRNVNYLLNLSSPLILESLRWLRLAWGKVHGQFLDEVEESAFATAFASWQNATKDFASKVNTGRITIELDFEYSECEAGILRRVEHPSFEQYHIRWKRWKKVASLFKLKNGLKDFFVFFGTLPIVEEELRHVEQNVERSVMGSDYDSMARGKYTQRLSSLTTCYLQRYFAKPVYASSGSQVFPPERLRPSLRPNSRNWEYWVY